MIAVHDNGRGLSEKALENIFYKYTRFATQDKQSAGTGLGLAICREIMKLMDGDIAVGTIPKAAPFSPCACRWLHEDLSRKRFLIS